MDPCLLPDCHYDFLFPHECAEFLETDHIWVYDDLCAILCFDNTSSDHVCSQTFDNSLENTGGHVAP